MPQIFLDLRVAVRYIIESQLCSKIARGGILRIEGNGRGEGGERLSTFVAGDVQECQVFLGERELGIDLRSLL